jgi:transcriptional regulator with XRE-family HTH domain
VAVVANENHGISCARRIRQQADEAEVTPPEIAQAINEHCAVGLLRAHRYAHGWTLLETAERLRAVLRGRGESATELAHQRISCWERGTDQPSPRYLDALCELYQARPDMLGFGHDYSPDSTPGVRQGQATQRLQHAVHAGDTPSEAEEETSLRVLRSPALTGEQRISPSLLEALRGIRRGADRLLETQSVSPATVDHWEMTVDTYEHLRMTAPPAVLLTQLLLDFAALRQILSCRQPLDFQRRLYYVMAQFAGMIGLTLVDNIDDRTETQAWFHTARLAADEAGDRILRAWVTVCEAASNLWYGRPAIRAVQLAQAAQALAGQPATGVRAWAFALEARGQALLGCRREALIAVRSAEAIYARLPPGEAHTGGFSFHPHLMHFCQENALMFASENKEALAHQDQAFRVSRAVPSHRVLVALDRASCLLHVGDLDEGCRLASQSLVTLPTGPWPGIVLFRAKEVAAAATSRSSHLAPVRELREIMRSAENSPHARNHQN